MTIVRKLAVAMLVFFAGTSAAFAQEAKVGEWEIYKQEDNCAAIAPFEGGALAWIGFFTTTGRTTVMILDEKQFGSIADNAPYEGRLMFVNNPEEKKLDMSWSDLPFTGAVLSSGKHGVMVSAPGDGILQSFANAQYFALVRGTSVVVSLKMVNGPAVIGALRKCIASL